MMEREMIDWDKPIETVGGLAAKVISRDFRSRGLGICVLVQIEEPNHSYTASYYQDGKAIALGPELRNRKVKREGWVNVYTSLFEEGKAMITKIYESEEAAKAIASSDVIATVKIEWEE